MSELKVRTRRRFGVVPDHILENKEMSLDARAVAAWLAGRQDGFTIRVEAMRTIFLGIGEKRWNGIRKELENAGWWRSDRRPTGPRGRFVWTHEFSDEGFLDDSTIPPFGMDAQSNHASSRHAGEGGNHKELNHKEVNQEEVNQKPPLPPTRGGKEMGGTPSIDELLKAAQWDAEQAGQKIGRGWLVAVKKRMVKGEDRDADIATWKRMTAALECEANRITAYEAALKGPALDPEVCAKGAAVYFSKGKQHAMRSAK